MKADYVQVVALVIKVGPSAADYDTSYSGEALMNIYIVKHHFCDRIIILATNYTELDKTRCLSWSISFAQTIVPIKLAEPWFSSLTTIKAQLTGVRSKKSH